MGKFRIGLVAALALASASCLATKSDIDLMVTINSATLTRVPATMKLMGTANVTFTYGAYGMGARVIHPQSMDVIVGGHVAGTLNAGMASGFVATFNPGDTMTVDIPFTCDGSADCGAAMACAAGASVPVNFVYRDDTRTPGTIGVIAGNAATVCTP